ncbi:hypothetical protein J4H86_06670 [Spiractinospora alimapuensis]|uniref:hypothetical protein n=1 Tax=Spiractinospora alimapuensis TaxID=2820884 RepID=UPI001F3E7088|nr:hypothetical protein [Spiractinospora alimapuensis]QVQ53436.1 hypothetical protein J4H86_06670 [Spiractinospora alimapuensis]
MTLYYSLGILFISVWLLTRSMRGLIDDQRADAPIAAKNRAERHRGLRLAEVLSRKADLLRDKALGEQTDTAADDAELATIDERIREIEAEYEPMLQRETHHEQRVRSIAYGFDVALTLAGIIGILVAIGGLISLAF